MLNECKLALRISTDAYDGELCSLMEAAVRDLEIAGVVIPGTVAFQYVNILRTRSGEDDDPQPYWSDESVMYDKLIMRAIFTYVRMHFGSPNDYERLKESYNIQKSQLMHATGYTNFGEGDGT